MRNPQPGRGRGHALGGRIPHLLDFNPRDLGAPSEINLDGYLGLRVWLHYQKRQGWKLLHCSQQSPEAASPVRKEPWVPPSNAAPQGEAQRPGPSGALLLPRRVGPEGSRVTARRKEADGDRGTFRKGSEYLPGPVRSDVNTSGFPGHTLFLEVAPWTEVPGGRGTETGRHRGPQRASAGRQRSQDKEEERGGESGEETGLNTGKDVASVPVTRETCDKDNGVKEEISHDTGTPGNLPSRDQTCGDTGQSWGFTVHTHSQRLTHRHTLTHRDTLTDMQRETHRYTHRHSHTHRDTLIDTQRHTHTDTHTQ